MEKDLKIKQWENGLKEIELKHIDYFKKRKSMRNGQSYLPIADYIIKNDNIVGIVKQYDVPVEIQKEIMILIKNFYHSQ